MENNTQVRVCVRQGLLDLTLGSKSHNIVVSVLLTYTACSLTMPQLHLSPKLQLEPNYSRFINVKFCVVFQKLDFIHQEMYMLLKCQVSKL